MIPEWQTAASNLLVAAGQKYTNKVMEELTLHFQPGVLPHFFVVQTLGKLATANCEFIILLRYYGRGQYYFVWYAVITLSDKNTNGVISAFDSKCECCLKSMILRGTYFFIPLFC